MIEKVKTLYSTALTAYSSLQPAVVNACVQCWRGRRERLLGSQSRADTGGFLRPGRAEQRPVQCTDSNISTGFSTSNNGWPDNEKEVKLRGSSQTRATAINRFTWPKIITRKFDSADWCRAEVSEGVG